MKPRAYYNEIDPVAAQWLRNLIDAGHIAPGDVDERSIEDVKAIDLIGYTQCHFFAGIGIWSHALRKAGVPDDFPIWTGSCPCQPFSAAGKGKGFADERHLWPAWHHLISICRPSTILGEQVAGKNGLAWLDIVSTDLEGVDYACGAVVAPAAGFGAPHIRERQYWVGIDRLGYGGREGLDRHFRHGNGSGKPGRIETDSVGPASPPSCVGGLGVADSAGPQPGRQRGAAPGHRGSFDPAGAISGLADTKGNGRGKEHPNSGRGGQGDNPQGVAAGYGAGGTGSGMADTVCYEKHQEQQRPEKDEGGRRSDKPSGRSLPCWQSKHPGPVNGFWRSADWLFCRDGKWRPVEPGTQQMVDGLARGVGRLRAFTQKEKEKVKALVDGTGFRDKIMRALLNGYAPQEIWHTLGGQIGFSQATILLAYLCESPGDRGQVFIGETQGGESAQKREMQPMQQSAPALACSPSGCGFSQQFADELGNALSILSQESAQFRDALAALSSFTGGPLAHGASARVGRLRGYGNGLCAVEAEEFIRAALF